MTLELDLEGDFFGSGLLITHRFIDDNFNIIGRVEKEFERIAKEKLFEQYEG